MTHVFCFGCGSDLGESDPDVVGMYSCLPCGQEIRDYAERGWAGARDEWFARPWWRRMFRTPPYSWVPEAWPNGVGRP